MASINTSETKVSPHVSLGLSPDHLMQIYYKMVLTRALDERAWALNRMGKVGFVASCRGHEAAQIGSASVIRPGVDFVLPYYRDLGVVITVGLTPMENMLSLLAKAEDINTHGRQMPGHWGHAGLRIISGSSPVATQLLHAAGIAYASRTKQEDAVSFVYFGDGATSKGDTHEAMNFAGIYKLPIVFICEFNGLAISAPQEKQMAVQNVADRARGYGFPGVTVDGFDVFAVYEATREAWERARRGEGPTFIECKVYRLFPHSSDDDDRRYRSQEEVEAARKKDPLDRFRSYVRAEGLLDDAKDAEIQSRVKKEVDEATDYAERAPDPALGDLFTQVYAE